MIEDRMEEQRRERSLPPPPDWPDGERGAVFRWDLCCGLRRVEADMVEHHVTLRLPEGSCTDMTGAVALALDIDPRVRIVEAYAGDALDITYVREGSGKWRAVASKARRRYWPERT